MTTEERLEKLERELAATKRRSRWLLAVVGLAVAGLALAWTWTKTTPTAQAQAASAPAKVIRANEFILEDAAGKTRATLDVGKGGPALNLLDENGKSRAAIGRDVCHSGHYRKQEMLPLDKIEQARRAVERLAGAVRPRKA